MKRSRIFLGLTTLGLAIAGVFAAKASNFGNTVGYYATANGVFKAGQVNSGCLFNATATNTCLTSGGRAYYTSLTTIAHQRVNTLKPLKYFVN